jgi:hypothetical protein
MDTIARLQEQSDDARKASSTSPKLATPEGRKRRRVGGLPGYPMHERAAFLPELINGDSLDHSLGSCLGCGHDLEPLPTIMTRVIQQVDINDVPLVIQELHGHPGWCSHWQNGIPAGQGRRSWMQAGVFSAGEVALQVEGGTQYSQLCAASLLSPQQTQEPPGRE